MFQNSIKDLPSYAAAGAIDNPPPPQINSNPITVSGNMATDGWAFMANPITEVQFYIDDSFEGTASINRSRPDISAIYPNVYPNTGFYHITDTKKYPNGEHTLIIKTISYGNLQTLLKRKFIVTGSLAQTMPNVTPPVIGLLLSPTPIGPTSKPQNAIVPSPTSSVVASATPTPSPEGTMEVSVENTVPSIAVKVIDLSNNQLIANSAGNLPK